MSTKKGVSAWAIILVICVYVGIFIFNYFFNYENIGMVFWVILIGGLCALKCVDWAGKVDGKANYALLYGAFLGLIGLLLCWSSYKSAKKRLAEAKKK